MPTIVALPIALPVVVPVGVTSQAAPIVAPQITAAIVAQGPQGPPGSLMQKSATSTFRLLSSAPTTNAQLVTSNPCRVFGIQGESVAAGRLYLKLYDTTGAPNVGVDMPVKTIPLPAGGVFIFELSGFAFQQGLGIALTGSFADTDTTPLAAGDIMTLNLDWAD